MEANTVSRRWLWTAVLCGVGYVVIGLVTAALARHAASNEMKQAWRLAAWALSAAAFGTHIWHERFRLDSPPLRTARHAASAVALAGFVLAVAATVHALGAGSGRLGAHVISLVAWPVLLFVPAFLVAWAAAAVLATRKRG